MTALRIRVEIKASIIRLDTHAYFSIKLKNWGVYLIIALTWLHKFPVMMSSVPDTPWLA